MPTHDHTSSASSDADAPAKTADAAPSNASSPPQENVMTKHQVFFVLLTVFVSIFLVALDRTIITTVRLLPPLP